MKTKQNVRGATKRSLRTLANLPEDQGSVLFLACTQRLTTVGLQFKGSDALFWPLGVLRGIWCTGMHAGTHTELLPIGKSITVTMVH